MATDKDIMSSLVATASSALNAAAGQISTTNALRLTGKLGKVLLILLLILNARSWPMMWHFRVFRPVLWLRLQDMILRLRGLFMSRKRKILMRDKWGDSISPVGQHPIETVVPYKTWASFDDCDFNLHLSNSCYAKTLDASRFKCSMQLFPMFFAAGGWIALAGTHYHFIREIPMLKAYEARTSIVAWEQKWFYVLHKFVRKPTKKEAAQIAKQAARTSSAEKAKEREATDNAPIHPQIMALRMPVVDDVTGSSPDPSATGTPNPSSSSSLNPPTSTQTTLSAAAAGLVSSALANGGLEEDGSILHTIVISQCCFKIGRITVPPALVLAANGMTGARGYSHAAPHPEWASEARKLRAVSEGGGLRTLRKFLTGGWKDVQEAAKKEGKKPWWDEAMGEEVAETNKRNLALVEGLRFGMEGTRTI